MTAILGFLLTIAIVVVFHELGHFLVARAVGVHIRAFGIGMGPTLWQKTDRKGCTWKVNAFPVGGYVSMLSRDDEQAKAEFDEKILAERSYESKRPWQRMAIAFAGPAANLVLAIVILATFAMIGTMTLSNRIATPAEGSILARAGVPGDVAIVEVNDRTVRTFQELTMQLMTSGGENGVQIRTQDDQGRMTSYALDLTNLRSSMNEDTFGLLGLRPASGDIVLGQINEGAAKDAGLMPGDRVVAVNDQDVTDVEFFRDYVAQRPGQAIRVEVLRQPDMTQPAQHLVLMVTPRAEVEGDRTIGRLGVMLGTMPDMVVEKAGFFDAVGIGIRKSWDLFESTARFLWRMVTGKVSTDSLTGPVGVAQQSGNSLSAGGLSFFLFCALISVNLAFFNLLPLPILDGGHIALCTYEMVRGKAPSANALIWMQKISISVLLALFAIGFINDLSRLMG